MEEARGNYSLWWESWRLGGTFHSIGNQGGGEEELFTLGGNHGGGERELFTPMENQGGGQAEKLFIFTHGEKSGSR